MKLYFPTIAVSFALAAQTLLGIGAVKINEEGATVATLTENRSQKVAISEKLGVVVEDAKVDTDLILSGFGTRHNILGSSYVVRSYTKTGEALDEATVLDEIKAMPVRALRLNIVFSIKAATLRDKFTEALVANGVKPKDDAKIKEVLDQIKFDVKPGDTVDFVTCVLPDGNEMIAVTSSSSPSTVITAQGADLGLKIWKIWFGKPVDADMAKIKKALIGKK